MTNCYGLSKQEKKTEQRERKEISRSKDNALCNGHLKGHLDTEARRFAFDLTGPFQKTLCSKLRRGK
jgi:hypothetical protein